MSRYSAIGLRAEAPADDDVPESVIESAKESVFEGTIGYEQSARIYAARDVLARIARGEPVGVSDAFADLLREAEHLHLSVDEAIARERRWAA